MSCDNECNAYGVFLLIIAKTRAEIVCTSCVKDASVNIDTVRFSHILEANGLYDLNYFLARTAFVISHKSESIETLLGVVWYLPINSPILIITNCPRTRKRICHEIWLSV